MKELNETDDEADWIVEFDAVAAIDLEVALVLFVVLLWVACVEGFVVRVDLQKATERQREKEKEAEKIRTKLRKYLKQKVKENTIQQKKKKHRKSRTKKENEKNKQR